MRDCELWDPEEIHSYITNCAAQNGITSPNESLPEHILFIYSINAFGAVIRIER